MKNKYWLAGLVVILVVVIAVISTQIGKEDGAVKEETKMELPENVSKISGGIEIKAGEDSLIVQSCAQEIIRVNYIPAGVDQTDSPIMGEYDCESAEPEVSSDDTAITLKTENMIAKVDRATNKVAVYDVDENLLLKEVDETFDSSRINFEYTIGDTFYGVEGFSASAKGTERYMEAPTFGTVSAGIQGGNGAPLLWNVNGYGVLIDTEKGRYSIDEGKLGFDVLSQPDLEYFVLAGEPKDIMSSVAFLTGKPPMFPKWALGFINSEWDIDQEELLDIVQTYRDKEIPLDVFTLDFDWKAWGEDQYGEFRWNEEKFPAGPTGELKEQMDEQGVKITGILKPRIHVETEQGAYATEQDFYWPNKKAYADYFSNKRVNDLDFTKKEVRDWYFEHLIPAFDQGIIGWWNDEQDVGYSSMQGLRMQQMLYEGQRAYTDERVWSINRNFFLGAQKYAYGLWSGDINSNFGSMAAQRERMMTAINNGEVKWGMDTGGFHGTPSPELYARWMQFAAFTPIYRVHGGEGEQRQPWVYGEQAEQIAKEAIELRYKLLPYMYAYERESYETGIGIVRPLMYDYPADTNVENYIDAWMFGDYLLVAPVVEKEQTEKDIYLPEGTWFDYTRGDTYEGGQTITYQVNAETWEDLPLFVKQGAIIPTQDVVQYVGQKLIDTVYVDVFPSEKETTFTYYDDDGHTYSYETGEFFKQPISTVKENDTITIRLDDVEGSYQPELKSYIFKVHGLSGKEVTMNGEQLQKSETLVETEWTTDIDQFGDVTYVKVEAGEKLDLQIK
ncbi:DUF5110 domain-containing protein [Bacillus sp. HMF5848]|uniref:TIM-barrel domain-containing protein n=1 Tax=Bacillus sp. HMF5848 TaxID=2495421 RepID=UPI000F7A3FA3|nr:TIM-barrel domain-containing protein [Bacillus sp. HMF5848]RSK26024.1 DUF5110 domain-containing protein [Bacillus sp. HMF5848]